MNIRVLTPLFRAILTDTLLAAVDGMKSAGGRARQLQLLSHRSGTPRLHRDASGSQRHRHRMPRPGQDACRNVRIFTRRRTRVKSALEVMAFIALHPRSLRRWRRAKTPSKYRFFRKDIRCHSFEAKSFPLYCVCCVLFQF